MRNNTIADLFIKEALRTESPITPELIERLTEPRTIRLLHSSMGLVTEAGELLDALKKFIFYGKDLDLVNIKEELGDLNWYQAVALDELGNSYEEIWAMVIKKLQARYKGSFNKEGAVNRDLGNERNVIEAINSSQKQIVHFLIDLDNKRKCDNFTIGDNITLDRELVNCGACISLMNLSKEIKEKINARRKRES